MTARPRSRLPFPVFCWLLGLTLAVASWIGGSTFDAIFSLVLFGVVGAVFLLGGRSETIRMVRGDLPDERWQSHDLRATAIAGLILICVVLAAFVVEVARGHDGSPYTWLSAVAGVSYLAAILVLRRRG